MKNHPSLVNWSWRGNSLCPRCSSKSLFLAFPQSLNSSGFITFSCLNSFTALWKTDSGILLKESMLEGWNSAEPPCLSCLRNSLGCETLFDLSGSSASLPGLLKVVKFFSSLLGFTVSANETLVGDFLGLNNG